MRSLAGCIFVGLLSASCIVEAPTGDNKGPAPAAPQALVPGAAGATAAKQLAFKSGANFDGKADLVAVTVQPPIVNPGEPARVTMYFHVIDEIPDDYVIFVHVEDVDGRAERMNVDHRPAGGQYPTNKWKKGENIKDEFSLFVPAGAGVRGLNLWAGFWDPKTDSRMKVTNPQAVRTDGNNRVLVAQIQVAPQQ